MHTVTLARRAMATRFEMVITGGDPARMRAAGEEALAEIDRIEARLSLYKPSSEIAHLNALAARSPVRVSPEVFALIKQAAALHVLTRGAFDITVAPLVRAWGFIDGVPSRPSTAEVNRLRECVGMCHVILNEPDRTVRFDQPGVMLDLGAIGKGYAIEQAASLMREAGVQSALIHGGTSTIYAIGAPPEAPSWRIAVENPLAAQADAGKSMTPDMMHRLEGASLKNERDSATGQGIFSVELCDTAFSVSSPSGKFFEADGRVFGHVIDPSTGEPGRAGFLAAVMLPSATETDALSTALLLLGEQGLSSLKSARPMIKGWFMGPDTRLICS